jgi:cytochrome c oxidase cbb3-type subunit 3
MLRPLASLLVLIWIVISSSASADDARGEMLFGQYCVACHQFGGKGGIGLPLTPKKMENVDDLYLIRTIQLGRPGRVMPAFTELSLDDVRSIVDYMRSASGTKSVVLSRLISRETRFVGKVFINCIA